MSFSCFCYLFVDLQYISLTQREPISNSEIFNFNSYLLFSFCSSGYRKIVISSKPTASSFSFGHKHNGRDDTVGPGPAQYDVSGLSVRGLQIFSLFENIWKTIV